MTNAFPDAWREGLYEAILRRRDVRAHFAGGAIEDAVLGRILEAAHHAPSVGFMQPWDFLVVRGEGTRRRVKEVFALSHAAEAEALPPERREAYLKLKLEGILESAINLCVTCDRERFGKAGIGRTAQPQTPMYSAVCAVQNLWLAARAEGIGVGWVSIVEPDDLKRILGIPEAIDIVAYLCLGPVTSFEETPDLERAGWQARVPAAGAVRVDCWDRPLDGSWPGLLAALSGA